MAETSGGSKKLLWIMVILVLLSSAGAAAAIYMVMDQRDGDTEATEEQQAMEREPPLDPEGSVRTVSGLRHNTLMNGNYRCTDPDCWCNNPHWKKPTLKSPRRIK